MTQYYVIKVYFCNTATQALKYNKKEEEDTHLITRKVSLVTV